MTAAVPEPQPADALLITRNADGTLRVENAPLPERITVHADVWEELELVDYDADADGPRPAALLEPIRHAGHVDGDGNPMAVDNDGYMLHIDAVNVSCSYRFNYRPTGDRTATGVLASWGEK